MPFPWWLQVPRPHLLFTFQPRGKHLVCLCYLIWLALPEVTQGLLGCVEGLVVLTFGSIFRDGCPSLQLLLSFHTCDLAFPPLPSASGCSQNPLLSLCSACWSQWILSQKEKHSCCPQIPQSPVRAKLCCNGAWWQEALRRSPRDFWSGAGA